MKKYIILLILCFGILNLSFAEEKDGAEPEELSWWDEESEDEESDEDKGALRIKDRSFEAGFSAFVGFDNNFLSAKQVLQDHVVIDIDELKDGFRFNLNMLVSPFFFNYNYKDKWGFGLSTAVQATGIIGLSGNMLTFSKADKEKSEIGGAAFVEIGAPVFFYINKFKIKVKPSVFYPLMYVDAAESDISYTYKNVNNETHTDISYKMRVYTAMSLEEGAAFELTASPGVDFHVGAEYPLAKVLGLTDILPFLDFDVGVDLINIPMVPGALKNYMEMSGNFGASGSDILDPEYDLSTLLVTEDPVHDTGKVNVFRPFKFLAHADWRPLGGSRLLTVIPVVGFAINPLYLEPFTMEAVLKGRLDLFNIFKVTVGTGFEDRLWRNSLDIALNLRAFEIDLGIDMRSADYDKSWQGAGLGVSIGLIFGW